jgi:predicted GNAT family acetyltransferase
MLNERASMAAFTDNLDRRRFELAEPGGVVFATYRRQDGRLYIDHVETPPALRGAGAAGRLMEAVDALARDEGLTLTPICSYAADWLRRRQKPAAAQPG